MSQAAHERWRERPLYEVECCAVRLEVPDRENRRVRKVLLDDVSFKALPGDMIALMGPSGAGKTTLLMALNGYLAPTSGQVRVNGDDLYSVYDSLRGVIGYVPQDDIVHSELTVIEAVTYSAKFRLPADTTTAELDRRVHATLEELGLDSVKHLQIGKPEKKVLSGGQRKRVNIAMELVADPVILFLDEPTSGLAADDTTALIRLLAGLTKRTGKTVIMTIHQPAKDEFEMFNLALIMGHGGVPLFFGPTSPDAYRFFGRAVGRDVTNPRDLFECLTFREKAIQEELGAHGTAASAQVAKREAAVRWRADFFRADNATYRAMFGGPRTVGEVSVAGGARPPLPRVSGQFRLLVSRYLAVKRRDVGGTAIMLLQAPIIAGLLALVFRNPAKRVVCGSGSELDHSSALFFLVIAAIWFGTSNAAREIVSERAVYLRERMVRLGLFSYVGSKLLVLAALCVLQCAVLLGIVWPALGLRGGAEAFLTELSLLTAASVNGVALGLLISTVVTSPEAATSLTPIVLIPQVVLGGTISPMSAASSAQVALMNLMPSRWGFQGLVTVERSAMPQCARELVTAATAGTAALKGALGFPAIDPWLPHAVLWSMSGFMLGAALVLLKRRDPI